MAGFQNVGYVDFLQFHRLGEGKYESIGLPIATKGLPQIGMKRMREIRELAAVLLEKKPDQEARDEAAAEKYGADPYEDYQEMLKRDDIDVIHVITFSGTHGQVGMDAISAGKHVLIEKPMEIKLDRIDALIKAAREKGVTLGGIFQRRFYPNTQTLLKALKAKRFGKIVLAELDGKVMRSDEYYQQDAWRGTWELDGSGNDGVRKRGSGGDQGDHLAVSRIRGQPVHSRRQGKLSATGGKHRAVAVCRARAGG